MTRDERTVAEMRRGAEVVAQNEERQALPHANNILSRAFNPNHRDTDPPPPPGYASWKDFHNRPQVGYLPNYRDGTSKDGT